MLFFISKKHQCWGASIVLLDLNVFALLDNVKVFATAENASGVLAYLHFEKWIRRSFYWERTICILCTKFWTSSVFQKWKAKNMRLNFIMSWLVVVEVPNCFLRDFWKMLTMAMLSHVSFCKALENCSHFNWFLLQIFNTKNQTYYILS